MGECSTARDDDLIRKAGFRVHARPANGPAIWVRRGDYYPQLRALRIALEYDKIHGQEELAGQAAKKKK